METRANYILIGLFTLAVIAGGFGFVYWFTNLGGIGERTKYEIVFEGTVSGLRTGASVLFNGIRVGEVSGLRLDRDRPQQVIATISVDRDVMVREDTRVGLDFQGLTGIASVSLKGGSAVAPPLEGQLLRADPGATQDVTQAAREVLRKIDAFVSDNEASLRTSFKNIETFTRTLADNSDRIDRILAGAESLVGGADKPGEFAEAARAVRAAADNLDQRTAEISTGLSRFSQSGLREWEKLAIDGRRMLGVVERTVKNIDRNPSRLIFGGGAPAEPTKRR
jgi:phospholipid/cholesterol/gamma-HCH transport system substrate-binding protein